jgi:hypothetical protein
MAELNKIIDNKLPSKRPIFTRHEVKVAGEKYDLHMHDIIQCIKALYGDPKHMQYLALCQKGIMSMLIELFGFIMRCKLVNGGGALRYFLFFFFVVAINRKIK